MTIFLRFPDKATFLATLAEGVVIEGETLNALPQGVEAISILPEQFRRGGKYELDAQYKLTILEAPKTSSGFHVNLKGEVPEAWAAYQIPTPKNAMRVF